MGIFDFLKRNKQTQTINQGNKTPLVLVIMDGIGTAQPSQGNAISQAETPNLNDFTANYPHGKLIASGESVGLPASEVGNTEVGHLTIGSGRVVYQDLLRINKSIESRDFFSNTAFENAVSHIKNHNSNLHIMGSIGTGKVHSSIDHLYALLEFCKIRALTNVYLHLITDGRDSDPLAGKDLVNSLSEHLTKDNLGFIATITGRYYAMDRDNRWDRVKKAYDCLTIGSGQHVKSASEAIESSYAAGKTDEFIDPINLVDDTGNPIALIKDDDALVFFNFRHDRAKEIAQAFTEGPNFDTNFKRQKVVKNLFFVSMTEYEENLPVSAIAFPRIEIKHSIPYWLREQSKNYISISESEKEKFVTYYFKGQSDDKLENETVEIIPSPKVATYDLKPEMSADAVTKAVIMAIDSQKYDFVLVNFANGDMVAHTGNIEATIKAVEKVDACLGEIIKAVDHQNGTLLITADHGNAEEMLTFPSGSFFFTTSQGKMNTEHSSNPVPFLIIANRYKGQSIDLGQGALADIAPTIFKLMNLPQPPEMTGQVLFPVNHDKPKENGVLNHESGLMHNQI